MNNDYKLNLISSFWREHAPKHVKSYQTCQVGTANLSSTVEKERVFAQCHNEWVKDFTGA